jgi:hypothetical protein
MVFQAASPEQRAHHEAGHAVSALHSGFRVLYATIEGYGDAQGVVHYNHPVASRAVSGLTLDRQGIIFCLSGVAAELLLAGADSGAAADAADVDLVYEDGELHLSVPPDLRDRWRVHGGGTDLPAAWAIAERHSRTDPEVTLAGMQYYWDEARVRLAADWAAVEAIAGALVRWRTLSGEDVTLLYRGSRPGTILTPVR